MSNIILALDQSTRASGWSIFIDNKLKDYGSWSIEKNLSLEKRLLLIINNIQDIINKYNPNIIYIENIQLQKDESYNIGVDTFQKLAQLQGAIILLCSYNNIEYHLVYPSEWRKSCNFLKGNDKKRQSQKKIAQEYVRQQYNVDCTEDEADAICIGIHAISREEIFDWS